MIRLGCTVRIIRIIRIIRIADGLPSPGPVVNICLGFSWDALAGSSWDSLQGALEGFSREILQLQPFPFSGGKGGGRHGGRQREGGERRISWDPRWILIWNSPEIGSDYANQVVSGNEDSICRWDSYRILWEGRRRKGRREGSKREIRTTTKKEIKRKG